MLATQPFDFFIVSFKHRTKMTKRGKKVRKKTHLMRPFSVWFYYTFSIIY